MDGVERRRRDVVNSRLKMLEMEVAFLRSDVRRLRSVYTVGWIIVAISVFLFATEIMM